ERLARLGRPSSLPGLHASSCVPSPAVWTTEQDAVSPVVRRTRPSLIMTMAAKTTTAAATMRLSMGFSRPPQMAVIQLSAWTRQGQSPVRGRRAPDVLERPDAELLLVMEGVLVGSAHVLVAVLGDERVVCLRRRPAVDHDVAPGSLDVAQQLGADVPLSPAEELGPFALGAVHALELGRIACLVGEDEGNDAGTLSSPPMT